MLTHSSYPRNKTLIPVLWRGRMSITTKRVYEPGLNETNEGASSKIIFSTCRINVGSLNLIFIPSEKVRSIALESLSEDMASFRSNGDSLTDFTIVCQDKTFPVHSAFICSRSNVFKAMLTNETKEAKDRKVVIKDASPEVMELFLR